MARKVKLTRELIAEICKVIENGASNIDACDLCMIATSTFYDWQQKADIDRERGVNSIYVEFSDSIKRAMAKYKQFHLGVINKAAKQEVWTASAWLLERKFPKEFAKTDRVSITKDDDNGMVDEILKAVNGINKDNENKDK